MFAKQRRQNLFSNQNNSCFVDARTQIQGGDVTVGIFPTEYNKLAKAWTLDTSQLKEGSWIQDLIQVLSYVATHFLVNQLEGLSLQRCSAVNKPWVMGGYR